MIHRTSSRIAAAKIRLGITRDPFTESDVRLAAAAKLREAHPDTGGKSDGAEIAKIKSDRGFLLRYATPDEAIQNKCPNCGGTGYVSG